MTTNSDEFLAHYGVLGMKWGIRRDRDGGGSSRSSGGSITSRTSGYVAPPLSEKEKSVLKAAGVNQNSAERLRAMYGPQTMSPQPPMHEGLSRRQKRILLGVGVGVGVVGLAATTAYLAKSGKLPLDKFLPKGKVKGAHANFDMFGDVFGEFADEAPKAPPPPKYSANFKKFIDSYNQAVVDRMEPVDPTTFSSIETRLQAGSILRRVSAAQETEIRPGGFFAAYKDSDIDRYKAVLPIMWKQWGIDKEEGYIVRLKANAEIKAPSEKKVYELFKSVFNDNVDYSELMGLDKGDPEGLMKFSENFDIYGDDVETQARAAIRGFAQSWASETPMTTHFFNKVREAGYNALPDMNDSGALSDSPLRIIDSSIFHIDGHEPLTKSAISKAQDAIAAIKHAFYRMIKDLYS